MEKSQSSDRKRALLLPLLINTTSLGRRKEIRGAECHWASQYVYQERIKLLNHQRTHSLWNFNRKSALNEMLTIFWNPNNCNLVVSNSIALLLWRVNIPRKLIFLGLWSYFAGTVDLGGSLLQYNGKRILRFRAHSLQVEETRKIYWSQGGSPEGRSFANQDFKLSCLSLSLADLSLSSVSCFDANPSCGH